MRALWIGILTGLAGAALALFASHWETRAHGVSDFEGARSYLVIFLFTPAGFLLGMLVGIVLAKVAGPAGMGGFLGQLGLSLLITLVAIGSALAVAYSTAPRTPLLDGKPLALDFELRLPPGRAAPADSNDGVFQVRVYAGKKDHQMAELNYAARSTSEGRAVIPGTVPLSSTTRQRTLSIDEGTSRALGFTLPLRASPRAADEQWSGWVPDNAERFWGFQVRYRVRRR